MDWFKGKSDPETMVFTIKYRFFPVNFPIIQFYELFIGFNGYDIMDLFMGFYIMDIGLNGVI